jgi:20S proteasome alpha/beta subunit
MTLVVALRCQLGVVLASDGQATSDAAGQPTRAPVRKLFDIGGRVAWGSAGSIGLQQTLQAELEALNGHSDNPGQLRRRLASVVAPLQQAAMRDFVPFAGAEPPELACLFCWCDASGPRILSIPRTGSDHQFHGRHAAIGSGDIFAELTVRSIAHLGTSELSVEQAKMVAYRTVADAIDVAAVYLGPPIQMYVVTADGARPVAQDEIDGGLADAVELWRARQREALGPLAA